MNEYFVPGAVPAPNSPGSSAIIRAEFTSIAAAFDKLPVLAGSAGEFVVVNETGTAMIASGFLFSDFVTLSGTQTLTNKTLAWADNTWPGFGTGATKTAGTGADNVLLLAEDSKLPALDGSLLTNLNPGELGVVPIANGGTSADTLAGAQAALGINLKADANNAVLTGAPTCPTPPVGNSSARIANTQFVTDTVAAIGAAIPSDATPLMNGVAAPGVHTFVARDDHVHPVDTSRAPASAETATGTSFSPVGGIAATNVQAAISELDTEKAPLASPALTGTPTSTTPLTSDNSTRIATTAFMQSLLAQQPSGVEVSDSTPLMNGVAAPGTGVEASRYDHVHPTDASRAALAATVTKTGATGSAVLPVGTTAQRDASPAKGYFRYNDELDIFEGYTEGVGWGQVGGGQMYGTAQRKAIFFNSQTIAENLTVLAGDNGGSFGPMTINDGVAVTIEDGAVWTIV